MAAKEAVVDFTNVKDGGGSFNKKRQPAGDYKAKVIKVEDAVSKKDNIGQWLFTITAGDGGSYPYYCKHVENQYWKIRNLLIAAGIAVPKKKVKVNPNILVGKTIAVTLEDDEYDGKLQSNIAATFPISELGDQADDEDASDDSDDDDDEEPTPPPAKKKKAPEPEPEDDDDDDDEDEEPAPPPKKKKAPAKVEVEDDELEELDIDDV